MPRVRPSLVCGLIAPSLWLATDILACARWRAYRPMERSISELSAIGAPTRPLVTGLDLVRDASLAVFAAGVRRSAPGGRALGATGSLVLANAAIDAGVVAFLPRDYALPTWARRNAANTLAMAAGVACYAGAMGTGAIAVPGWFRAVSAGIPLSYVGLTVLALALASRRATPSAATGAQERTMAYSYQLWVAALAVALLRREAGQRRVGQDPPGPSVGSTGCVA